MNTSATVDPAGEVAGQLSVERRDDVVRPEREARPPAATASCMSPV